MVVRCSSVSDESTFLIIVFIVFIVVVVVVIVGRAICTEQQLFRVIKRSSSRKNPTHTHTHDTTFSFAFFSRRLLLREIVNRLDTHLHTHTQYPFQAKNLMLMIIILYLFTLADERSCSSNDDDHDDAAFAISCVLFPDIGYMLATITLTV